VRPSRVSSRAEGSRDAAAVKRITGLKVRRTRPPAACAAAVGRDETWCRLELYARLFRAGFRRKLTLRRKCEFICDAVDGIKPAFHGADSSTDTDISDAPIV